MAPAAPAASLGRAVEIPVPSVSGRFDWFSLSSGDYSGRPTNAAASVSDRFTDRVGVSFGYRLVDHSFEITRPTWRGGIDYRFSGPYVALRIGL
jgi:hypothetical protein